MNITQRIKRNKKKTRGGEVRRELCDRVKKRRAPNGPSFFKSLELQA
jgi:hypothetical protein